VRGIFKNSAIFKKRRKNNKNLKREGVNMGTPFKWFVISATVGVVVFFMWNSEPHNIVTLACQIVM